MLPQGQWSAQKDYQDAQAELRMFNHNFRNSPADWVPKERQRLEAKIAALHALVPSLWRQWIDSVKRFVYLRRTA